MFSSITDFAISSQIPASDIALKPKIEDLIAPVPNLFTEQFL